MKLTNGRCAELACTMLYFALAAIGAGTLVYEGKHFIFRSLDYFLAAMSAFYLIASLVALKELARKPRCAFSLSQPELSPGKQRLIRAAGLLLPLPVIAYAIFFTSTVHSFNAGWSDWNRTQALLACEEPLFGHQRVQKLMMYFGSKSCRKGNHELAKRYVLQAVENTERNPKSSQTLARRQRSLSRICASLHQTEEANYWMARSKISSKPD